MKRTLISLLAVGLLALLASTPAIAGRGGGKSSTALSEAEKAGLLEMREEEKLARDVYLTLGEVWDVPIFDNIAASEQRHMDAVKNLLDKYGLADPAAGKSIGEFTEESGFADLFAQLVEKGNQSLADALEVGVAIEELDIADLTHLLEQVTHTDIANVYNNLLAGSENHLAAFSAQLAALQE